MKGDHDDTKNFHTIHIYHINLRYRINLTTLIQI